MPTQHELVGSKLFYELIFGSLPINIKWLNKQKIIKSTNSTTCSALKKIIGMTVFKPPPSKMVFKPPSKINSVRMQLHHPFRNYLNKLY